VRWLGASKVGFCCRLKGDCRSLRSASLRSGDKGWEQ
jgi:hypothetical protein